MPNPAQTQTPHPSGWSPERRARHAAAIQRWKPWEKSTGPRTAAGKARAAQNAAKPWLKADPDRALQRALRAHERYLSDIHACIRLGQIAVKNELLKKRETILHRSLQKQGPIVAANLESALLYAKLCKNLDFSPPLAVKVNANDDRKT